MGNSFTGGCICGAVRYEFAAEPIRSVNCHCRDCQKAGGGAFSSALVVLTEALKITGQAKYYDTKGDSGHIVSRGFCPDCGGRLFGKTKAMPDLTAVLAGR